MDGWMDGKLLLLKNGRNVDDPVPGSTIVQASHFIGTLGADGRPTPAILPAWILNS